jgi:hypothetical protein
MLFPAAHFPEPDVLGAVQTHLVAACIKDTLGAVIHVLSQTLCILCTILPLQVQNMDSSTQSVPGQYLSFFRKR